MPMWVPALVVALLMGAMFLAVGLFNRWARRQPNHPRNRGAAGGDDGLPLYLHASPPMHGPMGDGGTAMPATFSGGGGDFAGGGADGGWSDYGGGSDSGGGGDGGGDGGGGGD